MSIIQFPLQFEFQANQGFNTFFPASNQEIMTELQELVSGAGEQQIFLYGEDGFGKSHLLQACCQLAHKKGMSPFYYPFNKKNLPTLSMFEGLEEVELVCFDNVSEITGDLDWEQTFLNFLNQHLENNNRLVLAARSHPQDIAVKLPDLKNCLNAGLALKLEPLEETEIVEALIYKASYMGITISRKVGHFLVTHYASDMPSMWVLLGQLDKATLSAQRKLTIPFLKQILE
ncbi:MAG: DnaA regulatory inactivator Hda [Methylococcaceae bacterium]|nr:DnaA regulatory inactivator Hda [Methylococcaceae bacterium]